MSSDYRDLVVWQKSMLVIKAAYELTATFPKSEIYGLTSQMRRAAVSIPSNIAEGSRRSTPKDYRKFLLNSFGSGAELETQIEIAHDLSFTKLTESKNLRGLLDEVMRMLNRLTANLKEKVAQ